MATIQQIYIALFGRPADPEGLAFWTDLTNGGQDLSQLIGRLTAAPEALDRFEGLTSEEIVNLIYQSLFGRDADDEGLAFFASRLDSGEYSLETLAIRILDGATGSDAQIILNKEIAANQFTTRLDTDEELAAYVGLDAAQIGRDFLVGITDDPATIPTIEETDAHILLLFGPVEEPGEGQEPGTPPGGGQPPAATFTVDINDDGKLIFDGTATGPITLGFDGDDMLSASRGNVQATIIPQGGISGYDVTGVVLASSVALIVSSGILPLTAAEADGRSISGEGGVDIRGSDGDQVITISTEGENWIEGGTGADVITLGDGIDTVVVNGAPGELAAELAEARATLEADQENGTTAELEGAVGQADAELAEDLAANGETEELEAEVTAAQQALDEHVAEHGDDDVLQAEIDTATTQLGVREGLESDLSEAQAALNEANQAVTTAQQNVATAQTAVDAAQEIREISGEAALIRTALQNAPFNNSHPGQSGFNRQNARDAIDALDIDAALKTALKNAVPQQYHSNGHRNNYINNTSVDVIENYYGVDSIPSVNQAQAALNAANTNLQNQQQALETAEGQQTAAENARDAAEQALGDHIDLFGSSEDLQQTINTNQALLEERDGLRDDVTDAQEALGDRTALEEAVEAAQQALANRLALEEAVEEAEAALADAFEPESPIDGYDVVFGFEVGVDVIDLPSSAILAEGSYERSGDTSETTIDVLYFGDGGIVTFGDLNSADALEATGITITSEALLAEAFELLSEGVADGATVAFAYDFGEDDSGMFIFQGDIGGDIAIKLVGVESDSVAELFGYTISF